MAKIIDINIYESYIINIVKVINKCSEAKWTFTEEKVRQKLDRQISQIFLWWGKIGHYLIIYANINTILYFFTDTFIYTNRAHEFWYFSQTNIDLKWRQQTCP